MTTLLNNALESVHRASNVSDGGTHPNDKDRINETFLLLHQAGEILIKDEIQSWLEEKGWATKHAERIGSTAQQIGEGKSPVVHNGPWWKENIIEIWSAEQ